MKDNKWYRQPEMIVALSAVIISMCALFATVFQAYLERQSQHLSVWPRLELRVRTGSDFEILISNNGIGPAIVKSLKVSVDDEPVKSWHSTVQKLTGEEPQVAQINSIQTSVIPPGTETLMLHIEKGSSAEIFHQNYKRLDVEVCYCSVFDECWLIDIEDQFEEIVECRVDVKTGFLE